MVDLHFTPTRIPEWEDGLVSLRHPITSPPTSATTPPTPITREQLPPTTPPMSAPTSPPMSAPKVKHRGMLHQLRRLSVYHLRFEGREISEISDEEKLKILNKITLRLPDDIVPTELTEYTNQKATPLSPEILKQTSDFNFYLIVIPVQILIPEEKIRLVRLRLTLHMTPKTHRGMEVIAYDLYPQTLTKEKVTNLGEVNIDVSKALTFLPLMAPVAESLGIKLRFPLEWKTRNVLVQAVGLQSNPIEWYVKDEAIWNGFQGYAIIRVPKQLNIDISSDLAVELTQDSWWRRKKKKAQYKSDKHVYHLKAD